MKIVRKGIMPDGTKVQIEDWSEDYSFHTPSDTVAAYPKAKCTKNDKRWAYPVMSESFRADFTFEGEKEATRVFDDLISGKSVLKDFVKFMCSPDLVECL